MLSGMRFISLFQQRRVWLPTISGWIIILSLLLGIMIGATLNLHSFLAVQRPTDSSLLVVEGWIQPAELDQAIRVFQASSYSKIITTGGPVTPGLCDSGLNTYASLARDYLITHGIPDSKVIAVSAPASAQDRTFLSAVMVRNWINLSGQHTAALNVISSGVHSRRSWTLYRIAFGSNTRIGILSTQPIDYNSSAWWKTSVGTKTVVTELLSWIWTEFLFHPGPMNSYEEKWGPKPEKTNSSSRLPQSRAFHPLVKNCDCRHAYGAQIDTRKTANGIHG
jgi:hypothetical protein